MIYFVFLHALFKEKVMENSHISALQAKHESIEAKIRTEMNRPIPDSTLLSRLKKQKLRVKEELVAG